MKVWLLQAENLFGERQGCQRMKAKYLCRWPLGLDVLYAQYTAIVEKRLLAFQQRYIDDLGPNLEIEILGSVGYTTLDPQNVETILSIRFDGTLCTAIAGDDQTLGLMSQIIVWAQDAAHYFPSLGKAFSPKTEHRGSTLESSYVAPS